MKFLGLPVSLRLLHGRCLPGASWAIDEYLLNNKGTGSFPVPEAGESPTASGWSQGTETYVKSYLVHCRDGWERVEKPVQGGGWGCSDNGF